MLCLNLKSGTLSLFFLYEYLRDFVLLTFVMTRVLEHRMNIQHVSIIEDRVFDLFFSSFWGVPVLVDH